MHAIIIGGGIGGLAATLTLRRAGIDVSLFEQASELREIGAGIMISPNATRILHRLELAEPLRVAGVRPRARQLRRWDNGQVLARAPLADVCERDFGAPYYNFHRAELLDVLVGAVPDGVVHLDHRCVALTQRADHVEVQFHNGMVADADLVVGADGIHSTVRSVIVGPDSPRFSGDVAYRALVPANRLKHLDFDLDFTNWLGPNRHFVHYLVGAGARYVNLVAAVPGEWRVESWTAQGEVSAWLAEFAGWHPQIRALIEAVDTTNRWALYDRDPLPRWSVGRVTLLGDAAHAMLPRGAQGAVQAIEDAAVLAKCLARAERNDIGAALQRYELIRKPRATQCQERSRQNGLMFHLADGEEQHRRDASLSDPTIGSTAGDAWLYGHDVEAEFE